MMNANCSARTVAVVSAWARLSQGMPKNVATKRTTTMASDMSAHQFSPLCIFSMFGAAAFSRALRRVERMIQIMPTTPMRVTAL